MSENAKQRLERLENEGLRLDGKWNRRVVRDANGSLAIHEVYYDSEGNITAWTEHGENAVDHEEGLEGLKGSILATYEQNIRACEMPVLDWKMLPHGNH